MLTPAFLKQLPSLSHVLEARAGEHPDRPAFSDSGGALTYGELDSEATRLAAALFAAGVRPGDRAVLLLPAGITFVRIFWALQRLGAASCALNPYAPPAASVRRAAAARPAVVIHDPAAAEGFAAHAAGLKCLTPAELDAAAGMHGTWPGAPSDLAFLQTTSGTSGEPRIAMITQQNILALLWSMFRTIELSDRDCYVGWVPPWHDLGLVRFVIGSPFYGGRCVIVPPAVHTIPLWLETIARERATITGAPDFAWRLATRLGDASLDLSSLRYGVNGGEPVRSSTIRKFEEKFGLRNVIRPGYGLAEATLGVSFASETEDVVTDERGNVSCGRPAADVEVRIDDDGSGAGEIVVRGPTVFAGYFDAPEATADVLRDGWLHTGDIGRFDGEGRLYILGRKRAMLKKGGAVHAPRELEEAAHHVAGVKIAAAVSLPPGEAMATEEIVVAVELEDGAPDAETTARLVAFAVRDEIGFAPDRVLVLTPRSILRTWNGKIRHDALRQELLSGALAGRGGILFSGAR